MSKIDYHALREAAEKATKGKWAVEFDDEIYSTDGINHEQIAMVFSENESRDAEFIAAANPATVLALLDELDKWQQESSAWQAVAEKQLALAEDAEKRIAELEAREISLPERSSMLHRTAFHDDYQTVMAYKVSEVIDAIRATGIRIKGE
ncbi:TPA: ead/Ea22-like family protein [Escherichia coli]|nr:ead/Ea22-like family protein [Escherichia coli]